MAPIPSDLLVNRIQNEASTVPAGASQHQLQNSHAASSLVLRPREDRADTQEANYPSIASRADINTAAALRAQYAIETPKPSRRRRKKKAVVHQPAHSTTMDTTDSDSDAPIIDTTAKIPLHSKKTTRQQRKHQRKIEQQFISTHNPSRSNNKANLLSLPSELLTEILSLVFPSDIPSLHLTSRVIHDVLTTHEAAVAREIILRRYWTLHRCFPVPIAMSAVPEDAHSALLSPKRQEMLNIHRKSYHQHIRPINPEEVCTCMTCVFAWNNLCLIVDLAHWQGHLKRREPLPIIPRGEAPSWNEELLDRNADLVREAIRRPFVYAWILEMHLETITGTIVRHARWRRKIPSNPAESSKSPFAASSGGTGAEVAGGGGIPLGPASVLASQSSTIPSTKPRLYDLRNADIEIGTDEFLDREGPPSYDFPYMRDNYYDLEAYVPNRKWSDDSGRWFYYPSAPVSHERDLEWVRSWAMGAGWRGG